MSTLQVPGGPVGGTASPLSSSAHSIHSSTSSPSITSTASQSLLPAAAEVQPLSLKVLRLHRPSLGELPTVALEPCDVAQPVMNALFQREHGGTQMDSPRLPFLLGETLRLHSGPGTTYLGEVFSAIVCVNNESGSPLREVIVKAEIRTASQRLVLVDTTDKPRDVLMPGDTVDVVVSHEIKELGVHTLVCVAHYVTAKDERKLFNQYFKFSVQNPLSVKTKVYTVKDNVFLEAQVQNATPRVIYLDSVRFDPPPVFTIEDFSVNEHVIAPPQGESELRKLYGAGGLPSANTLGPHDVQQFLYVLRPALGRAGSSSSSLAPPPPPGGAPPPPTGAPTELTENELLLRARQSTAIGKLDIVWRTALGEKGRLQTAQLQRKPVAVGETVSVSLAVLPSEVVVEEPFEATLALRNMTDKPVDLILTLNKTRMMGILYVGVAVIRVGVVAPFATAKVNIKLLALMHGLQQLMGLTVTDVTARRSVDIEKVADILVRRERTVTEA